jgi:hypothetical protein
LDEFSGCKPATDATDRVRAATSSTYDGVWLRRVVPDLRAVFGAGTMTDDLRLCITARLPLRWNFVGFRT